MAGRLLISLFLLGQMMDILSTYVAINIFSFIEANPLADRMFGTIGMGQVMLFKVVFALTLALVYLYSKKRSHKLHRPLGTSLVLGSIGVWLAVIVNSIGIFLSFTS